ncbi:hypothetical protein [Rhodohalobacter sp.]|uniref:hypothetical protein n=1 Tax=Rhodohalobacter sp. TaxID=1974210 RepID=UPI002ACEF54A|nr:hypothetical protein [Rhodohalobacter sp.]MDZ7757701.1 hypothetical protein [Rhodohalobacter sp.]
MREIIIASILCMLCTDVVAQSISITEISPGFQANLALGRQVSLSFDYETMNSDGIRIFVRPVTSGSLTPNYSASGSPVYRGSGRGSANFTIQSGSATVDQIRVRSVNLQNEMLFEFFIPVKLTFSPQILTQYMNRDLVISESDRVARAGNRAEVLQPETTAAPDIPALPDCADSDENEVVEKKVKPDGTLELHYADGSIVGILSAGAMDGMNSYRIDPVSQDTTYFRSLFSQVQAAYPPGFIGSEAAVNEDWLQSLNAWIEHHGDRLLGRIDTLLDDESYNAYLSYEENSDLSIYEKVNFRYTFLERLAE